MKTDYYVLDIETGGLPQDVLQEIMPEFEADKRLTDPAKIKASLESKQSEWLDSAALDAHRGEVVAIGIRHNGEESILHGISERDMLSGLNKFAEAESHKTVVGHYLLGFDIPFLCRRMWKHGIRPPHNWYECSPCRAKWAFDTKFVWGCGNNDQRISLDMLSWHLGVGRKNGEGKHFAELYKANPTEALQYLSNDLKLTEGCYLKMR